jgi:hypothetical protein
LTIHIVGLSCMILLIEFQQGLRFKMG